MTKQDLQKELKEKVKPGIKPSDLRKLKRSKSAGDITLSESKTFPSTSPLPSSVSVSRSKSNQTFNDPKYPFTTLISQQEELEQLRKETKSKSTTIDLLRKKVENLEKTQSQANSTQELDQSLTKRHQNLKDWFSQYQKNKKLDQELSENIDQASEELTTQGQTITQLRTENRKLKQTNQSLQKDLNLTQRLVEHRKSPLPNLPHPDYFKYALYACGAIWIVMILLKAQKVNALTLKE